MQDAHVSGRLAEFAPPKIGTPAKEATPLFDQLSGIPDGMRMPHKPRVTEYMSRTAGVTNV